MTTSETELDTLIAKYPSEEDAIERLREFISEQYSAEDFQKKVFTLDRLLSLVRPQSTWDFAYVLSDLATKGILHQLVRLHSSSGPGLRDFERIEDVPATIHDMTIDQEVEVSPENLKVVYKLGVNDRL